MFACPKRIRQMAARVLLVWLAVLATSIVNACVVAPHLHAASADGHDMGHQEVGAQQPYRFEAADEDDPLGRMRRRVSISAAMSRPVRPVSSRRPIPGLASAWRHVSRRQGSCGPQMPSCISRRSACP
jgi:hypothetical protein